MFLSETVLNEIHSRAHDYDKENVFPIEDYKLLKEVGYYKAFVPKEFGGHGLSLKEIAHEQTALAKAAPGTALGINMHQIIVGLGRYMVQHGNPKGEQILRDAANGELLAFAISEPANDRVLFGSTCKAESKEGGVYFNGPKVFISMIKYCTKLVTYAQEDTKEGPMSIFGYLDNNPETIVVDDTWNTLGMRATQSQSVMLKDAFTPEDRILTRVAPGPSADPVVKGIFGYFEILLGATYHGIGERAIEIGIETVKRRKSVAQNTTYDQDKDIRWRIAEAAITVDAIQPQIDRISDDFENDVDYGKYLMPRLSAIKNRAVESSKIAVEEMIRASGGRSYYNDQELSRLLRDVYAGLFQPSDQESLHNAWATILLGPIQ